MFSAESAIFLVVSLLSGFIIYFQIQKSLLFVILSILLAMLLVFFSKFSLSYLQQKDHKMHMRISLFFSSFFVQLLIIATGGLFSAFVITLHLFTLGMSVLFNVSSAIVYLLLSVGLLMSTILIDPQMKLLFQQDPWSVVLHGISFLVVIPLAHMLVSTYHLKDAISKMLSENLKTKELQDASIFRGLGELVFITDKTLKVIFANDAAKKNLGLETTELVGGELIKLLPLESTSGIPVNSQTLSIDQAISDHTVHLVKGFSLLPKQGGRKMPVIIQIRPINDTESGSLKQIVVVITPDLSSSKVDQIDNKMAKSRRKFLREQLEKELQNFPQPYNEFMLLMAQVDDLLLFQDVQSNGIEEHKSLIESEQIIKNAQIAANKIVQSIGVSIVYLPGQENLVKLATQLHNNEYSLYSHTKSTSLSGIDAEWIGTLIVQVIKLLSFVSLQTDKKVILSTGFNDKDQVIIILAVKANPEVGMQVGELLLANYGALKQNQLFTMGSGLEGVTAQKLAELLKTSLNLKYDTVSQTMYATIVITP